MFFAHRLTTSPVASEKRDPGLPGVHFRCTFSKVFKCYLIPRSRSQSIIYIVASRVV